MGHVADYLKKHWSKIPPELQGVILGEIGQAAYNKRLGDEIDEETWTRLFTSVLSKSSK
jgi:hypothetical protein